MTYGNMKAILEYCKKEGITLDPEVLKGLPKLDVFLKANFPILKLDTRVVREIVFSRWRSHLLEFVEICDLETEDMLYCLYLLNGQINYNDFEVLYNACVAEGLGADREALDLIASQRHYTEKQAVLHACTIPEIRNNKEVLKLIVDAWPSELKNVLIKAFLSPKISVEMFMKVAKASNSTLIPEIFQFCHEEEKIEDISILELLGNSGNTSSLRVIIKAYRNPDIRNNEYIFQKIVESPWPENEILLSAREADVIRENKEVFDALLGIKEPALKKLFIGVCKDPVLKNNINTLIALSYADTEEKMRESITARKREILEAEKQKLKELINAGNQAELYKMMQESEAYSYYENEEMVISGR